MALKPSNDASWTLGKVAILCKSTDHPISSVELQYKRDRTQPGRRWRQQRRRSPRVNSFTAGRWPHRLHTRTTSRRGLQLACFQPCHRILSKGARITTMSVRNSVNSDSSAWHGTAHPTIDPYTLYRSHVSHNGFRTSTGSISEIKQLTTKRLNSVITTTAKSQTHSLNYLTLPLDQQLLPDAEDVTVQPMRVPD